MLTIRGGRVHDFGLLCVPRLAWAAQLCGNLSWWCSILDLRLSRTHDSSGVHDSSDALYFL